MRTTLSAALLLAMTAPAVAQPRKPMSEAEFAKAKPAVGEALPDLTVYTADGKELKTSSLRGHHTVLIFGCLT